MNNFLDFIFVYSLKFKSPEYHQWNSTISSFLKNIYTYYIVVNCIYLWERKMIYIKWENDENFIEKYILSDCE